jgi:hypothetical protein
MKTPQTGREQTHGAGSKPLQQTVSGKEISFDP